MRKKFGTQIDCGANTIFVGNFYKFIELPYNKLVSKATIMEEGRHDRLRQNKRRRAAIV